VPVAVEGAGRGVRPVSARCFEHHRAAEGVPDDDERIVDLGQDLAESLAPGAVVGIFRLGHDREEDLVSRGPASSS
jgi:hypothetical protein